MKSSLDFKLKLYFNMYKDTPLPNSDVFRKKIIMKHGKFPYLCELIVMIVNYQIKTYGTTLTGSHVIVGKDIRNGKSTKSKKTWYI